jgi:CRP-like cAMP-binding protein
MKNDTSALWYFESVNLYNILCPHKINQWSATHIYTRIGKNDFIYMPDDTCTHIYLIVEGQVRIGHYLDCGEEVVCSILGKGELFGELALAGEERRSDFAQAMRDTVLCPLTIDHLKSLMYKDHELSFRVLRLMGLRLLKLERKLELLVFKDSRTRIIEFLKDAASWKGKKVGTETMIAGRITHKDIAALTGTSRQTVTTVLNDLKEKNLINFDRTKILIRDLDKLK